MATPKERTTALDRIADALDIEVAAAAERLASAERSADRSRQRYQRLIEARSELRALR